MQDVQNIPNPDVNSYGGEDDFNSQSENRDVERPEESIPLPPDGDRNVPVEAPPAAPPDPPIDEPTDAPTRLV